VKAIDIAVYLWILQICLFIVGNIYGSFSYDQPSLLIGSSDVTSILGGSGSVTDIASHLLAVFIVPLLMGLIAYKLLGIDFGTTLIFCITLAIGLFFFGRTLWYVFSIGSLIKAIVEGFTQGYAVIDAKIEWAMNGIGYLISFIALMDWWRGTSMRQMG